MDHPRLLLGSCFGSTSCLKTQPSGKNWVYRSSPSTVCILRAYLYVQDVPCPSRAAAQSLSMILSTSLGRGSVPIGFSHHNRIWPTHQVKNNNNNAYTRPTLSHAAWPERKSNPISFAPSFTRILRGQHPISHKADSPLKWPNSKK